MAKVSCLLSDYHIQSIYHSAGEKTCEFSFEGESVWRVRLCVCAQAQVGVYKLFSTSMNERVRESRHLGEGFKSDILLMYFYFGRDMRYHVPKYPSITPQVLCDGWMISKKRQHMWLLVRDTLYYY